MYFGVVSGALIERIQFALLATCERSAGGISGAVISPGRKLALVRQSLLLSIQECLVERCKIVVGERCKVNPETFYNHHPASMQRIYTAMQGQSLILSCRWKGMS